MIKTIKNSKSTLKTWLLDKPARFTLWMFLISAVLIGISYVPKLMMIPFMDSLIMLVFLAVLLLSIYDLIKHLPHDNMPHTDFIAIMNGYKIISLLIFGIWLWLALWVSRDIRLATTDVTSHVSVTLSVVIKTVWFILGGYLLGLWISGIYAKYKRAKEIGFDTWKIILTMPFCFMMTWMPGYLVTDKKQQSNITIKSKWYKKFTDWVLSNNYRTLFVFLVFFVFANVIFSQTVQLVIFTLILFLIYMFWKSVAKENFSKQMNVGYIWTGIILNISMLILFVKNVSPIIAMIFGHY